MIKVGDTVRYLNAVGGGVVKKIEGKVAYVDDDGFETPILVNELVVVLPAGHEKKTGGPNLFFDQKAFDAAKNRPSQTSSQTNPTPINTPTPQPEKVVETGYGDKLNISLAFEPISIRDLSKSDFNAILVNDSNYFLFFSFLRRNADERGWHTVYAGEVAPNELIDVAVIRHGELNDYEKIAVQYLAYKKEKEFEMKPAATISRRLDLSKFFKLHCFRPGVYFESPVMEIPFVKDDRAQADMTSLVSDYAATLASARIKDTPAKKQPRGKEMNPHKLLPLIELDLHIDSLVDTTAGMENKDMLQLQLDTVRKIMKENSKRKGQKIVFIHGKGDGVLRKAVRDLLKKEYPACELQDASFQEYGFGATLVTIHS
ncbi:MAG: DUF2027 domain-containing protein [Muribaculaceae bacterium]|nr:DUF2027 domain-containing protein [Muribaculaceae bacterium]